MDGEDIRNNAEAPSTEETLTFLEAAERVLQKNGASMHYRAITEEAISENMLSSAGGTPEATMAAQFSMQIKKAEERGFIPRIVRVGRGTYGLSSWEEKGLRREIEEHNKKVRDDLLGKIRLLSPEGFEELLGKLLTVLGFEKVEVTSRSNDGGIDIRGTLVVGDVLPIKMAVQAKRWKNNVQRPTVQQVRGSLGAHEQGLVVTTGGFAPGAKQEAQKPDAVPIGLMDGERLVELLAANDIGAKRTSVDIVELVDEDQEE